MILFLVLGNQSLDELESYVREHFNNVENKNVTPNVWSDHPYESGNPTITHVVPIKDIRTLNMSFPIPDTQEHFRNKPVSYISHLVSIIQHYPVLTGCVEYYCTEFVSIFSMHPVQ